MHESRKSNQVVSAIARRLRCPGCARRYRMQDFTQIDQAENVSVFEIRCAMCRRNRLIIALWENRRLALFHTDLDAAEWQHYRALPPVRSDDVIRFHLAMQSYEGDLSDVLEDPLLNDSAFPE